MKSLIYLSLVVLMTVAHADIQAPPGERHGASTKLGRALSNIVAGLAEAPQYTLSNIDNGNFMATTTTGIGRGLKRVGFGVFELVTFFAPTNHGTYKPQYQKYIIFGADQHISHNPDFGYTEYPIVLDIDAYYKD